MSSTMRSAGALGADHSVRSRRIPSARTMEPPSEMASRVSTHSGTSEPRAGRNGASLCRGAQPGPRCREQRLSQRAKRDVRGCRATASGEDRSARGAGPVGELAHQAALSDSGRPPDHEHLAGCPPCHLQLGELLVAADHDRAESVAARFGSSRRVAHSFRPYDPLPALTRRRPARTVLDPFARYSLVAIGAATPSRTTTGINRAARASNSARPGASSLMIANSRSRSWPSATTARAS